MTDNDNILKKLENIETILTLAYSNTIEKEIEKLASSEQRKKMWVLIDGKKMTKQIADELKVTEEAVNYFLRQLSDVNLAINIRGEPPYRKINYVPPSWIELFK